MKVNIRQMQNNHTSSPEFLCQRPGSNVSASHSVQQSARRITILRPSGFSAGCVAAAVLLGGMLFTGPVTMADEEQPIAPEAVALGRPVEFERDIYPILEANCIACHNQALSESDLILEDGASIMKGGSAGAAVVPGSPDDSLLYKVAARIEEPVMPPWPNEVQAKKLTPGQLGLLRQWITEGAVAGSGTRTAVMNWQPINDQLKAVYSLDIDSHGRFVAAGRGGGVTVYDRGVGNHAVQLVDPAIQLPEQTAPLAHHDFVHAIAFHPNGNLLATSGYREVKLWKRQLDSANSMAALPAGATLLTTTDDGNVLVLANAEQGVTIVNAASGDIQQQWETEGQHTTAATMTTAEQPLLILALADGRLQTRRMTDGELLHTSEPLPAPVTSLSAELAGGRLAAVSTDGIVRLLTVAPDTGAVAVAAEIKSEAGAIQRLAADDSIIVTLAADQKAELWKTEDGSRTMGFDLPAAVAAVSVSAAAERAVFVLADGQTLLWSLKLTEAKQLAALNQDLTMLRNTQQAESLKAQREARSTVLTTKVEESEKELTAQKEAATNSMAERDKAVTAATEAKAKLDPLVAATAAAKVALEAAPEDEAAKKAVEAAEKAETTAKEAAAAAESQQQLAEKSLEFANAAVTRAEQRVADRKAQQLLAQQDAESAAAALEKSKTDMQGRVIQSVDAALLTTAQMVATTDSAGTIRLWNLIDGQPLDVLSAVTNVNEGAAVGQIVNIESAGSLLLLITDAQQVLSRTALPGWSLLTTLGSSPDPSESVFVDRVLALAFSPDGSLLATGGGEASRQGQVTLWNVTDHSLVRQLTDAHSDTVYGVEFSPDGKLLATASADKFAKVFDVATGQHVQSYEGHTHHVMDVSWKGDLTQLASAGADNAIKVWNAETGEQTRTISTYKKQVTSLNFVGLQDQILSSSGDKRVFLHTAANGAAVREFAGSTDFVYRAVCTPDGAVIAAGGEDGVVRIWNGSDGKELATFAP